MSDLTALTIGAASEELAGREVSSSDLVGAYLARIGALAPTLSCDVTVRADEARGRMRGARGVTDAGRSTGPRSRSRTHRGPLTRCVTDLGLMHDAMAGFDPEHMEAVRAPDESGYAGTVRGVWLTRWLPV